MTTPKARFFATPGAWRAWLEKHHATASELVVGFHKRATGKRSIKRAFAARSDDRTGTYAYEQRRQATLPPTYEARMRRAPGAWRLGVLPVVAALVSAQQTIGPLRRKGDAPER